MPRIIGAVFVSLLLLPCAYAVPQTRGPMVSEEETRNAVISAPRPEYPYEARRRWLSGSGVAVLEVDTASGRVTRAYMERSTGSSILDNEATDTFERWRFRPGAIECCVRVPITFAIARGGRMITTYAKKEKPMRDLLAPFLKNNTLLSGKLPAYPTFPPWSTKQGRGVFELHIGKDGRVMHVVVLKPSGDGRFDDVTRQALAKWRFARGPLILELPLAFSLTPESYRVDIR